ncbi:restriction endonuclease [Burkholderia cepacia JBK9]|uniref:5-methylcytosine-specific restriction endonuclease system specificity protein McrC n=1 Tax=Burkholderia arboris TaxID=488730 RepID=UPI0004D5621D|nr:5-methylcytosine-specific restriction endonuclease system specificity protein McrC [Burkholderia arboris]ALX17069.1 restriction endonuclease [Burkholderia cepacia JBK9]MCA8493716.1 5-methylcytosine-specific restriction endonuclease system specificity protein McrC [Burkholderia arboris]
MVTMPETAGYALGVASSGMLGRIPVRNLWLLMLYASDLYRAHGTRFVGIEENPDDLADLVAELLIHAVEERQRRQLSAGYRASEAVLNRVRGRIDVLTTERQQLLARGSVACRFEALTIDTPRNRYVRGALEYIARSVTSSRARRCAALANYLKMAGVTGAVPTRAQMSAERFRRNDQDDRLMVDAAKLAFDLALPTESAGSRAMPIPDRDATWVRKLFEKAVGGFYRINLAEDGWCVRTGTIYQWRVTGKTEGIDDILPRMETDIILDHVPTRHRIVIDTKFTSIVTKGRYREDVLKSGYVYQMYAYIFSQKGRGDPHAESATGLLLHPSVNAHVDELAIIQDHAVRFGTVDLAAHPREIKAQLLRFADPKGYVIG